MGSPIRGDRRPGLRAIDWARGCFPILGKPIQYDPTDRWQTIPGSISRMRGGPSPFMERDLHVIVFVNLGCPQLAIAVRPSADDWVPPVFSSNLFKIREGQRRHKMDSAPYSL